MPAALSHKAKALSFLRSNSSCRAENCACCSAAVPGGETAGLSAAPVPKGRPAAPPGAPAARPAGPAGGPARCRHGSCARQLQHLRAPGKYSPHPSKAPPAPLHFLRCPGAAPETDGAAVRFLLRFPIALGGQFLEPVLGALIHRCWKKSAAEFHCAHRRYSTGLQTRPGRSWRSGGTGPRQCPAAHSPPGSRPAPCPAQAGPAHKIPRWRRAGSCPRPGSWAADIPVCGDAAHSLFRCSNTSST